MNMITLFDESKSLVPQVTAILKDQGIDDIEAWEQHVHPDTNNQHHGIQRFLINRYWRTILGTFDEDTMEARLFLTDKGSINEWLVNFKERVAPCISRNIHRKINSMTTSSST